MHPSADRRPCVCRAPQRGCRPDAVKPARIVDADQACGRRPEIAVFECVSVTETAAEKLVGLTRRTAMILAGLSRDPAPTLVRHIYDLHAVRDHIDKTAAIDLARQIAQKDAEEFKNQYPAYHADIAGETHKALRVWTVEPASQDIYGNFVAAMVYGESADFRTAMATVAGLADAAWPA